MVRCMFKIVQFGIFHLCSKVSRIKMRLLMKAKVFVLVYMIAIISTSPVEDVKLIHTVGLDPSVTVKLQGYDCQNPSSVSISIIFIFPLPWIVSKITHLPSFSEPPCLPYLQYCIETLCSRKLKIESHITFRQDLFPWKRLVTVLQ